MGPNVALVIALIWLSIWVPNHENHWAKQKLEELTRDLGGPHDPDPDWLRALEKINESQQALNRIREVPEERQKSRPD